MIFEIFSLASCTLFSPKTLRPKSIASFIVSILTVFVTATSFISKGLRPDLIAADEIFLNTFLYFQVIVSIKRNILS